jgi:Asp-tRNA(Asn)/Glu-tRNA(Gln) amidotransferase C subunit
MSDIESIIESIKSKKHIEFTRDNIDADELEEVMDEFEQLFSSDTIDAVADPVFVYYHQAVAVAFYDLELCYGAYLI